MTLSTGAVSFLVPLKKKFNSLPRNIRGAIAILVFAPIVLIVDLLVRYDDMLWQAKSTLPIFSRIPNSDLLFLSCATGVILYMFINMTVALFVSMRSKRVRRVVAVLAFLHVSMTISTLLFYVYLMSVEALISLLYMSIDLSVAILLYTPSSSAWFDYTESLAPQTE